MTLKSLDLAQAVRGDGGWPRAPKGKPGGGGILAEVASL